MDGELHWENVTAVTAGPGVIWLKEKYLHLSQS